MTGTRRRGGARALPLAAVVLVVVSSCSGTPPTASGPTVDVTLRNFSIQSSTSTVAAGPIAFAVYNRGAATHEFVVVRTNLPADGLPIASDGVSVDEDALARIGEISDVDIWTTRTLDLNLAPGHYVFFCNLEGHYLGGMHRSLVVSSHG